MYKKPTKMFIESQLKIFDEVIELLANKYKISKNEFLISKELLIKICTRIHQREDYYQYFHGGTKLAQLRRSGIVAYWILKYFPLRSINPEKKYNINVHFAYYVILSAAVAESGATAKNSSKIQGVFSTEFEDYFLRSLSEYDISKEAFMLIAECLALAVKMAIK